MVNQLSLEQKEKVEVLNNFIGYGNPKNAKFWFMGIEEGGDQLDLINNDEDKNKFELLKQKNNNEISYITVEDYKKNNIELQKEKGADAFINNYVKAENYWFSKSNFMKLNLYPFSRCSDGAPYTSEFIKSFGFNNREEYEISKFKDIRIKNLIKFFEDFNFLNSDAVCFCFGAGYWEQYQCFFEKLLGESIPFTVEDIVIERYKKKVSKYKHFNNKIFLIYHLSSSGFTQEHMNKIAKKHKLNELLL